jgi:hypothetical protein
MHGSLYGNSEGLTRGLIEWLIEPGDEFVSFRFAARTMLELGKELISSDEVALYELIKNGIDAGSPRVEITGWVLLPHRAYVAALERLDEGVSSRNVLTELRTKILPGLPTARISAFMATLERTAGRPRRFRAALKAAYRRHNWIEIKDTGEGMSIETLSDVYLTVGTRSRRRMNVAGASFLGDKGVGRLSAMRLGNYLEVTTSTTEERHWNKLRIDWTLFSHESEKAVGDIDVDPRRGSLKEVRAERGTVIRVSDLTADWNDTNFADLFQGKIARMVDPFVPTTRNGARNYTPQVFLITKVYFGPASSTRCPAGVCKQANRLDSYTPAGLSCCRCITRIAEAGAASIGE